MQYFELNERQVTSQDILNALDKVIQFFDEYISPFGVARTYSAGVAVKTPNGGIVIVHNKIVSVEVTKSTLDIKVGCPNRLMSLVLNLFVKYLPKNTAQFSTARSRGGRLYILRLDGENILIQPYRLGSTISVCDNQVFVSGRRPVFVVENKVMDWPTNKIANETLEAFCQAFEAARVIGYQIAMPFLTEQPFQAVKEYVDRAEKFLFYNIWRGALDFNNPSDMTGFYDLPLDLRVVVMAVAYKFSIRHFSIACFDLGNVRSFAIKFLERVDGYASYCALGKLPRGVKVTTI